MTETLIAVTSSRPGPAVSTKQPWSNSSASDGESYSVTNWSLSTKTRPPASSATARNTTPQGVSDNASHHRWPTG
jgi:hypothetical protein